MKIDEKDLIRNHRLKPNEAQEMMQTIDRINDYIKNHPEDLIHAQMRYPIDDPRLADNIFPVYINPRAYKGIFDAS